MKEVISKAIIKRLGEKGISQRKCAIQNSIEYQSFNSFLKGKMALPIEDIENVLTYLELEITKKE